jgi:two-component system, OmpR family, alkaline phosphatase synthesis response regulator PhoP
MITTSNKSNKVLIVDDEPDIVELLQYTFAKSGYDVRTASNGKDTITILHDFMPQLVILDVMMPDIDGIETCRQIRELPEGKEVFVMFLTARSEEFAEKAAFDMGADTYITKPIKPRALLSRVAAIFKRLNSASSYVSEVIVGDLTINRSNYIVFQGRQKKVLPKKEFELLYFFAQNPNTVFSREELLDTLWGTDVYVLARTVDVHMSKLRDKIGEHYIKTIKGIGYKFEIPA